MPPRWPDISIAGRAYSLAHLQSFTMNVTPKAPGAPTFKVYVSFGSHTFTKEWEDDHPLPFKVRYNGEDRCFCPIRHGHSLSLPAIIRQSATGRVYFSLRQKYLIIENLPGVNAPYAVFFNIEKAASSEFDAAMFVVTAHERPNLPSKKSLEAITFATLISKTAAGQPIRRPPKKY
jgi:hypothetical protein